MKTLGFNVPKYAVIESYEYLGLLALENKWSIRSFMPPGSKFGPKDLQDFSNYPIEKSYIPPHCPSINSDLAVGFCRRLLDHKLKPLACPVIDPKNAIFAGAGIRQNSNIRLEIAIGPVMVRKVTREGIIDFSFSFTKGTTPGLIGTPNIDNGLLAVINDLNNKLPSGYMIELSWYNYPIGCYNKKQIYWDMYQNDKFPDIFR